MDFFNSDPKCKTITKCCTIANKCKAKMIKISSRTYLNQYIFSTIIKTMMMK